MPSGAARPFLFLVPRARSKYAPCRALSKLNCLLGLPPLETPTPFARPERWVLTCSPICSGRAFKSLPRSSRSTERRGGEAVILGRGTSRSCSTPLSLKTTLLCAPRFTRPSRRTWGARRDCSSSTPRAFPLLSVPETSRTVSRPRLVPGLATDLAISRKAT